MNKRGPGGRVPIEKSKIARVQKRLETELVVAIKTEFFDGKKTIAEVCEIFANKQSPEWIRGVCTGRIHGSIDAK